MNFAPATTHPLLLLLHALAQYQVPKLSSIDVSTIKVEPKTLIRRPPSANSMRGADGAGNHQQQQQQRKKTHKEREAGAYRSMLLDSK